jgi:hypothetical protein
VTEQLGEHTDARLDLALLLLGGVVPAVLLEVTLLACGLDLLGDLRAALAGQGVKLSSESVEGFLGQPRDRAVCSHSVSLQERNRPRVAGS